MQLRQVTKILNQHKKDQKQFDNQLSEYLDSLRAILSGPLPGEKSRETMKVALKKGSIEFEDELYHRWMSL